MLDNSTIAAEDRDRVYVFNNVLRFEYLDPKVRELAFRGYDAGGGKKGREEGG